MGSKTIGQVIAEGKLKRFMDPRLIRALGHPVREHILAVLNERVASPNEIGKEIELSVESFHHHVEVLEEFDCIERVGTKQRRGATEHFYRAKTCLLIEDSDWENVPSTLKADMSIHNVRAIFDDTLSAIQGGTFEARKDRHVTWLPGYLDEQGWREQMTVLDETLARSRDIHERSAMRIAEGGMPGKPATVAILGFENAGTDGDMS